MKKFAITSTAFKGSVEIWYDETGLLCYMNATSMIASSFTHCAVLINIPLNLQHLYAKNNRLPEDLFITEIV